MKKSLIAALLISAMLFALAGCTGSYNEFSSDGGVNYRPEMLYEASGNVVDTYNQSDEDYGKIIENPFISTLTQNVSTFSADVDTGSYCYFRKLVNSRYNLSSLIATAGSAIRTEEMINYFKYDYKLPAENELFGVEAQIAPCPWNSEAVLMTVGLQTEAKTPAAGNNLVFLIDVSGSMNSPDKLPLLKKAFTYLVGHLDADDRVSIVTYAGNDTVVLDGCSGSQGETILQKLDSLESGGSTNGEAGIKRAYQIAESHFIPGGNNRIIMASDGDLNVGISLASELEALVSSKRSAGVYLSTLGFGTGNYRDANMEAIADNGNGVYYYIDSEEEAEKVFGTDIISSLYTVAEDVKLQITFDSSSISSYRLVGYENRLLNKEDFENDTKDAGEVGAGHAVTVCYELILTEEAKTASEPWMKLAVRYKNPGETQSLLNEYNIGAESYTDTPNDNFKFICSVIELTLILHKSSYATDLSIDNIVASLNALDLSSDSLKTAFRDLVTALATQR